MMEEQDQHVEYQQQPPPQPITPTPKPIPNLARLRIPTTPTSSAPSSPSFKAPSSPSFASRAPSSPSRTPAVLTAPSTPTFFVPDMGSPDNNFLRSPHQPSPLIHRTMAKRFGGGGEIDRDGEGSGAVLGDENGHDDVHNELIFTSEDIFVIPPMLSIDEKLFQDEVILWSHYVKITTTLRQSYSPLIFGEIFNIIFFTFFFVTTIILTYSANKYISTRAAVVTLWLMAPMILFSGFMFVRLLFEIIQCRLLGARVRVKSMSYPSITDLRIGRDSIGFMARHSRPFITFIGLDNNVNAINKILVQQRDNPSQFGPLDSPQSLDKQHIPEKYGELVHSNELPFLEGTVKFVIGYLWVGVLMLLVRAGHGWMGLYFASILLLPLMFLLTNTMDKVDVLGARHIVFLRVGLAYLNGCRYGRNALSLGYDNAYPLESSYNIKTNQGTISFYNYTFANINSDDVIGTEEIVFHKHTEALRN